LWILNLPPTKMPYSLPAAIVARRRKGFYTTDDTLTEAKALILTDRQRNDICFTLLHAHGRFCSYDQRDFLRQLKVFQDMKCVLLDCNIKERTIAGKTVWAFTVQPPSLEGTNMCPLAMALGILVNGFTYVAYEKSTADLVFRALEKNLPVD